jgi:flagellin
MTFSKILGAPPGGDLGDGISTVLSSNLPPGQLNYTIDVPGFPAEVGLDAAALDAHPTDTTFVINGVSVTIVPMDDLSAIKAKLAIASESASLELKYNGNLALFSTINAGSSQVISITSADNPAIETQNTGTDAVLSALEFYNPDGSLNMEFNSTVGFIAEGNKVSIQSSNGLGIQLGIKVFFNPTVGSPSHNDYVYANGKASDVPPYSNGLPTNVPVSMASNIEDYGSIILQTGASFNQSTQVGIPRMDSEGLGLMEYKAGIRQVILDYSSASSVQNAIDVLDRSLSRVYGARANLGAYQNRLEQTVMNLDSASVYTESSRSRIQDTDMASAMTELTQNNIKYQAGIAILSQANQRPQQVLSLMQ